MNGSWNAHLNPSLPPRSHPDFAGVDDIIINLAKERQPGIVERMIHYFFLIFNKRFKESHLSKQNASNIYKFEKL